MITIDRSASTSVHDQLLEQLRFQIASGQYKIEDALPSTRKLAEQLGISFHTVRKVYQALEQEGLLDARQGSAYVVRQRAPLAKGERMERGAAVVHETLQRLVGLGLEESEIEYLFQEQLALLEGVGTRYKLLVLAPFRDMAELCAEQLKLYLQQPIEAATPAELSRHQDADYLFAPFTLLREAMAQVPQADVHGYGTYLRPEALEPVARLLDSQTLGLVTRYKDGVPPLLEAIRNQTGFSGQMIAASLDDNDRTFGASLLQQVDYLLFTPLCRRRLRPMLDQAPPHAEINVIVSRDSLEAIRQVVPV